MELRACKEAEESESPVQSRDEGIEEEEVWLLVLLSLMSLFLLQ